jgi:hypothetical protein
MDDDLGVKISPNQPKLSFTFETTKSGVWWWWWQQSTRQYFVTKPDATHTTEIPNLTAFDSKIYIRRRKEVFFPITTSQA